MRVWLTWVAVALQVLVLLFMAGEREWVYRNGQKICLRTQPVDPRDPFRGDYVRLDYDVNWVTEDRMDATLSGANSRTAGQRVYAILAEDESGRFSVERLTRQKPESGLYLRGRTVYSTGRSGVQVQYGIEAYFVAEGKGKAIEDGRRRGNVRIPMDMEVAIGRGGMAVLRSHRFCPLGVGLELDMATNRQVRGATVSIVNVSSNDLEIVDPAWKGCLRLECDNRRSWSGNAWEWVGGKEMPSIPDSAGVILIKPGESKSVAVDLCKPEWFVYEPGKAPVPLQEIGTVAAFRFVYFVPPAGKSDEDRRCDRVWRGELRSQLFTTRGRWD